MQQASKSDVSVGGGGLSTEGLVKGCQLGKGARHCLGLDKPTSSQGDTINNLVVIY